MRCTAATALWCSATLLFVGGTFGVVTFGERRIAEQTTIDEQLTGQVAADDAAVLARGSLLAERGRLRAELRRLGTGRDAAPVVARFVRDAARLTQEHHTTIASIAAPPAPAAPAARAEPLESTPLAVTVEGRYADVLDVVRALSALSVPAEIEIVSVVRTTRPGAVAVVAALHVVLQRVAVAAITDAGTGPH
jgi:hypothetical protein